MSEEVDAQDITRYRDQLKEDLVDTFKQWIPKRKRTIEKLEELASKLHEQHMDVSKSTIAGASVSIVGGILAIAGLIVTPLTFGAGLVVSLAGAGIGGAGSVVMSVSKVVEIILEKLGLKEVQRAIDDDKEAHSQLQEKLDNLERFIFDLRKMGSNGFAFLHDHAEGFTTSTEERIDLFARFFAGVFVRGFGGGWGFRCCWYLRASWGSGASAHGQFSWRSCWCRAVTSGYLHVGEIVFRCA